MNQFTKLAITTANSRIRSIGSMTGQEIYFTVPQSCLDSYDKPAMRYPYISPNKLYKILESKGIESIEGIKYLCKIISDDTAINGARPIWILLNTGTSCGHIARHFPQLVQADMGPSWTVYRSATLTNGELPNG